MKRLTILLALLAAFAVIGIGIASAGGNSDQQKYAPIASGSSDSGTCGNDWAVDSFKRIYTVETTPNEDGTYNVTEEFKSGSFITIDGHSPGACDGHPDNGNTVPYGVTGKMKGIFSIVVTGGTFNPDATCDAPCYTADFVKAAFGESATYDVPSFYFSYHTGQYGDWVNASADQGGNQGDITTS